MAIKKLLIAAALASPALASAATTVDYNPSYFDLYYMPSAKIKTTVETGLGNATFKDTGDGYGLKGRFGLGEMFFLSGEYQANDYTTDEDDNEDLDRDLNIYRIGGGVAIPNTPFFVEGEYIGVDLGDDNEGNDEEANGYGIHGGAAMTFGERFTVNAKIGYVDVDDYDGFEYLVGGAFNFTTHLAVFADYRGTDLKGGSNTKLELNDFRTGVRFTF